MPGLRGERSGLESLSNWPARHARRQAAAAASAASLDDRMGRIETALLDLRQIVCEEDTAVSKRLDKLETIFLLIDWHALERAIAHKFAVEVQVDPALVEQRSYQPESEASPERQAAIREGHPRRAPLNAIPPLPMAGPPGLRLDTILLQPDMFDIIDLSECEVADEVAPTPAADAAEPPVVSQFTGSTASSPSSTTLKRQGVGASSADDFNVAYPMFSDDIVQGLSTPMGEPMHLGGDELLAEIFTLQLMLTKANDEKAIQIALITEEKQGIIDGLQRQVNELSQRPAAEGVDELRAEIDTLQLMLSTANDEKAIQIEIITEEKQTIIDDLQRHVNEQRPTTAGVDELRAEIGMLNLMISTAHDEKAIQIEIITEEKQILIDELQQQVNELSQRPIADGADVLQTEIDSLKLMVTDPDSVALLERDTDSLQCTTDAGFSTTNDEKAIMLSKANEEQAIRLDAANKVASQVTSNTDETQMNIDELQQKVVDMLSICNDLLCNEKMMTADKANIKPNEDSVETDMESRVLHESRDVADDENQEKANNTPDEDSALTDMELIALHDSFDPAGDESGEDAEVTPGADFTAADVETSAPPESVAPSGCVEYARRQYEPMPAAERAQRVRRRHALICAEFGLMPDEDSAEDSTAIDNARRVELGALRESFHATDEEHEEKADITPDEDSIATDLEPSGSQESFDATHDENERPTGSCMPEIFKATSGHARDQAQNSNMQFVANIPYEDPVFEFETTFDHTDGSRLGIWIHYCQQGFRIVAIYPDELVDRWNAQQPGLVQIGDIIVNVNGVTGHEGMNQEFHKLQVSQIRFCRYTHLPEDFEALGAA